MNGALLLLKHGGNIEAQDEHVRIEKKVNKSIDCYFSWKHLYLNRHIICRLRLGKF